MPSSSKKKFYAVAVGRKTGIFESWEECSQHVTGFPKARYKSFSTREDAQAFVVEEGGEGEKNTMRSATMTRASGAAIGMADACDDLPVVTPAMKKKKDLRFLSSLSLLPSPLPSSAMLSSQTSLPITEDTKGEPNLSHSVSAEWRKAREREAVEVYVDGACRANGVKGQARGGYGGYYAANDARNFFCSLFDNEPQTNSRAELRAVIHVLRTAVEAEPCYNLRIFSDSTYVVLGANYYLHKWVHSHFRRSNGSAVVNSDLWRTLSSMRLQHASRYARRLEMQFNYAPAVASMLAKELALKLIHVKGHSGVHGNEMADRLAVMGALYGTST